MSVSKFYECSEKVAEVLDKYLNVTLDDMEPINEMIKSYEEHYRNLQNQHEDYHLGIKDY